MSQPCFIYFKFKLIHEYFTMTVKKRRTKMTIDNFVTASGKILLNVVVFHAHVFISTKNTKYGDLFLSTLKFSVNSLEKIELSSSCVFKKEI